MIILTEEKGIILVIPLTRKSRLAGHRPIGQGLAESTNKLHSH